MAILRPNQLPSAVLPLSSTDLFVVDQGSGGVNAAEPQDVVDAVAPVVSQADAEAGLDNVERMTSLRTKQSIASEVGATIASAAQGALASTAVQPSRQIVAGNGLTDGGALSADVTLNVGAGTGISVTADAVGLDATTQSRLIIGGGTTSQVLQKASNTDYDVEWATVAAATAVSYAPQTLTSPEQAQARTNIGLATITPSDGTVTTAKIVDANVTNAKLANMAQATVKGRASGAGTGAPTDLVASDLFTILGALVPARPITSAGAGQVQALNSTAGGGLTLPSGGTWFAAWLGFSSGALSNGFQVSVAAGGTTVQAGSGSITWAGFCWRIA